MKVPYEVCATGFESFAAYGSKEEALPIAKSTNDTATKNDVENIVI